VFVTDFARKDKEWMHDARRIAGGYAQRVNRVTRIDRMSDTGGSEAGTDEAPDCGVPLP
jgi:hypothetical protein